ncbi:MAG: di-heme enzyme [Acidobacteria bacterium]|nr:di-heme enzyme [Acidobacteriota bacterium]
MRRTSLVVTVALLAAALANGARPLAAPEYGWTLPAGFSPPDVPADNPMSEAKVALGRHLFYDGRLSGNGTQSCATCHDQARAFADGRPRGVGSTGQEHPRGSMSLVNVAYARVLTWANPSVTRLEDQALVPMFGEHPVELGLDPADRWLEPLRADERYREMFAAAFPGEPASITRDRVVKSIAAFERAIVSARSPYDRYHFDRDESAISESAKRGEILFHSRPFSCFTCHGGVHFSDAMGRGPAREPTTFHNTGLYNLAGAFSYPPENLGTYEITKRPGDVGRFKAPTLRNIAVTAPYMHDGSVATLDEVLDHYAAGGRTISNGPSRGIGHDNPNKAEAVRGFVLTAEARRDLIAFLQSLTDQALLADPRFSDPFRR